MHGLGASNSSDCSMARNIAVYAAKVPSGIDTIAILGQGNGDNHG